MELLYGPRPKPFYAHLCPRSSKPSWSSRHGNECPWVHFGLIHWSPWCCSSCHFNSIFVTPFQSNLARKNTLVMIHNLGIWQRYAAFLLLNSHPKRYKHRLLKGLSRDVGGQVGMRSSIDHMRHQQDRDVADPVWAVDWSRWTLGDQQFGSPGKNNDQRLKDRSSPLDAQGWHS